MKQAYFGPLRGLPACAAALFTRWWVGAALLLLALLPLAARAQTTPPA